MERKLSNKGIFGFFKRKKQVKRLDQIFNTVMGDVRIFEQRQDYRGAVIASFGGLTTIAHDLLNMIRSSNTTGREFGFEISNEANISAEVMDEYMVSFEIARYTDREVTYEDYQEAIQRLDICFRGIREQDVEVVEPRGKQKKKSTKKKVVKKRKSIKKKV